MNNQPFKGRNITINEARAKEDRPDFVAGVRPGYPMRPAGVSRASRTGFTPRTSSGSQEYALNPMENERTGRAERRSRNLGPDAKPPRKRKSRYENRGEMGHHKKGPLRERSGGQFFGSYEDDLSEDDSDYDYLSDFKESKEEDAS